MTWRSARKKKLIAEAEAKFAKVMDAFDRGFVTDAERHQQVIRVWTDATESVRQAVFDNFRQHAL